VQLFIFILKKFTYPNFKQTKKRELQLFPATGGIWRNLVQKELNQVHALRKLLISPLYYLKSPDLSSNKNQSKMLFYFV